VRENIYEIVNLAKTNINRLSYENTVRLRLVEKALRRFEEEIEKLRQNGYEERVVKFVEKIPDTLPST